MELEAYRKRYSLVSLVIFTFAMLLVAGAGYAALRFLDDPDKLKLLYAATGVTLAGAIEILRRVAREWGRVDLLLIWLKNADDEDAKSIMDDLKAALSDPRAPAASG
ncbi:MAG: hypothetical protein Q8Q88_06630 [Phenylobacterium sp.]|uniref:hypothetical protein n=1 Tax=Phenylobacterium sp. TaxID=1871053 RepID=UPI0027337E34|nr:hypothetical protein [Phenylobacterium sp.]MDP3746710.1 hypothetical protein [Phenylobacterium sp.]